MNAGIMMARNIAIIVGVAAIVAGAAFLKNRDRTEKNVTHGELPRLVELGAGKCTACKNMKPIIEELQKTYAGQLQVDSIDVIDQADAAKPFNWKLIPCQVFLDADGKELWRHEGFLSKADILAKWAEFGFKFTDSSQPQTTQSAAAEYTQPDALQVQPNRASRIDEQDDEVSAIGASDDFRVIAYYFHRTQRCPTCLTIEEYAKQSIEQVFRDELTNGLIEYKPVNIEKPGNEHFQKDYELTAQSLVLVRIQDGKPGEWKNLPKIWEVVGDYGAFMQYVESEFTRFIASGTAGSSQGSSSPQ